MPPAVGRVAGHGSKRAPATTRSPPLERPYGASPATRCSEEGHSSGSLPVVADLSREQYVRLTTFTKDGRPKRTPVWIADLGGGRAGLTAGGDTWKVKRIRTTPVVELAPSDGRGRVKDGVATITGTAHLVAADEADYAPIESALIAKYGFQFRLFRLAAKIRRSLGLTESLCGIVITLD